MILPREILIWRERERDEQKRLKEDLEGRLLLVQERNKCISMENANLRSEISEDENFKTLHVTVLGDPEVSE